MLNHRFPQIVLIVVPALLAASALAQDTAPAKKPVPDAAAQAQATKLVKEVYGDDYAKAKTADQKVALAKKLLHKAGETRNDPNALYALLNVAKDMAILAANADTAFAAIDALAQTFEVNPLELKAEALIAASKRARVPAEHGSIANLALAVMEGAIAADRYDLATQVGELGLAEARLAPKSQMIQPILARLRETGDLATAYESMRKAAAILDQAPVDPEANLTVGKYLCLVKGDWDKGISYLALGTDEKLKALAVKELKGVPDAEGQVALGDGWWDLASASEGVAQKQLQGRAAYWYRKALPAVTGLVKDKVAGRVAETSDGASTEKRQRPESSPKANKRPSRNSLVKPTEIFFREESEIRKRWNLPASSNWQIKEGKLTIHGPCSLSSKFTVEGDCEVVIFLALPGRSGSLGRPSISLFGETHRLELCKGRTLLVVRKGSQLRVDNTTYTIKEASQQQPSRLSFNVTYDCQAVFSGIAIRADGLIFP